MARQTIQLQPAPRMSAVPKCCVHLALAALMSLQMLPYLLLPVEQKSPLLKCSWKAAEFS